MNEPSPIVYTRLKDLHLSTSLVRGGKPMATLVAPELHRAGAERIRQAVQELTGTSLPIVGEDAPEARLPLEGNLIVLGNRSTNRTIAALYERYFTLLDLRYPGPGGYEVRSLHNPFGGGHNVIFVGGSDPEGVGRGVDTLLGILERVTKSERDLAVGWLMEIRLGAGVVVPTELTQFETWEASAGYGSVGYFGWNSISKRMAMYYMTGDPLHAREAVRLAFPDKKAFEEITRIDEERIEDKDDPLAGPYHYNAHMMILYWDLIEESPVFSTDERLRITNAFSRQFFHRQDWGWRRPIYERSMKGEPLPPPPAQVGSRHGQWSAISLYCLGRYFRKDYPEPFWQGCVDYAMWHFSPLHEHGWVSGEADNLFWYNTGMAPILSYVLLTGDRKPIESGVLPVLLRGQDALVSGRTPDWALRSGALDYFHKAAYLTGDGRWLAYRLRTGVDTGIFRLGQSYWPAPGLEPELPRDLVGRWTVNPLPEPLWRTRKTGFPPEESFFFGSYRSAADASGDYLLVKGFNGASRNPYHTFTVLELRLDGRTLLQGYRNQVQARLDGIVEPHIAMDAALRHRDVTGETATATAEVPDASFGAWRRTIVQRRGRYALVVDNLAFRSGGDGMEVEFLFETVSPPTRERDGGIGFEVRPEKDGDAARRGGVWSADALPTACRERVARMAWRGPVLAGDRRAFFSLIGVDLVGCHRVSDTAAALALPEPALAVSGGHAGLEGEVVVLAGDHLYGRRLTRAGLEGMLLKAGSPVDVDWDFGSGVLNLVAGAEVQVAVAGSSGTQEFDLKPGRHRLEAVVPDAEVLNRTKDRLKALLAKAVAGKDGPVPRASSGNSRQGPSLPVGMDARLDGPIVDLLPVPLSAGPALCAAVGQTVHVLGPDGKALRRMEADGPIRMLHWWPEHRLLLAGCADERVIAFDESGSRKWTFVSEMDYEVFRAAKQYWFKSAPRHEGIHGLHTGVFLDGKSQAFVGSACTLEILNESGGLVKRRAVFWGPGAIFRIVEGPEGSLHLLIARDITDGAHLAIISNRDLDGVKHGFHTVPEGATYVPGWMSMTRNHLFYEDLDGDGVREVCSEITGSWNRVTVWDREGKALHDISLGPGDFMPARNIRDLDLADLDGDGKQEIVAATSLGLILALTHRCEKRWASRVDSPATVLKGIVDGTDRGVLIGCENGHVVMLDSGGGHAAAGEVAGTPTRIARFAGMTVIGTESGHLRGFGKGS